MTKNMKKFLLNVFVSLSLFQPSTAISVNEGKLIATTLIGQETTSPTQTNSQTETTGQTQTMVSNVASIAGEFVRIPAGTFMMGSDYFLYDPEMPQHRVIITKAFEMGKYEVTQALWENTMQDNPSHFKNPDKPVERVSWEEVQIFISRLNERDVQHTYRLPTEAEWEYAARAGSNKDESMQDLDEIAWDAENSGKAPIDAGTIWLTDRANYIEKIFGQNECQPHPVGQKKANAWGLHDIHGNVYEWVQDWYDINYYKNSPPNDPEGPSSGTVRVARGGSWMMPWSYARSAARATFNPTDKVHAVGFRLVRTERKP